MSGPMHLVVSSLNCATGRKLERPGWCSYLRPLQWQRPGPCPDNPSRWSTTHTAEQCKKAWGLTSLIRYNFLSDHRLHSEYERDTCTFSEHYCIPSNVPAPVLTYCWCFRDKGKNKLKPKYESVYVGDNWLAPQSIIFYYSHPLNAENFISMLRAVQTSCGLWKKEIRNKLRDW